MVLNSEVPLLVMESTATIDNVFHFQIIRSSCRSHFLGRYTSSSRHQISLSPHIHRYYLYNSNKKEEEEEAYPTVPCTSSPFPRNSPLHSYSYQSLRLVLLLRLVCAYCREFPSAFFPSVLVENCLGTRPPVTRRRKHITIMQLQHLSFSSQAS